MKKLMFFFFLIVLSGIVYPQTNEQDSLALVALYNSTDGDHWANNTNWLVTEVKDWVGITVDTAGRVVQIDLYSKGLEGPLPSDIGDLSRLTVLILFGNKLNGSIPSEIGNLTELTELRLGGNELTGSIPPEIGNLT